MQKTANLSPQPPSTPAPQHPCNLNDKYLTGHDITPFWVGFHNGNFDIYDRGRPASPGLESLAEDGSTALISQEFLSSGDGSSDGVVIGSEGIAPGSIDPGEIASTTFTLDSDDPNSQFFAGIPESAIAPVNDFCIIQSSCVAA